MAKRANVLPLAGLFLLGAGILLVVLAWARPIGPTTAPTASPQPSPTATRTPEPIIPTRTPTREMASATPSPTATATGRPSPTPTVTETAPPTTIPTAVATAIPATSTPVTTPTVQPVPTATPVSTNAWWLERPRWGIGVSHRSINSYDVSSLRLGWYLNWSTYTNPPRPGGAEFAQMIRLRGGRLRPDAGTIASIAQANPGALWLVGNEPDVKWQDNVGPTVYARLYHEAYSAIKGADPTARVAIGGVAQPTPLRLRYLDIILASYREQFGAEMPVDVWNVHNFILREERDSWGVDIPPGLSDQHGKLYEIDDGDNMQLFRSQIVSFRQWMAARGYQNKPLIVTEYGILMPPEYGFPPERVVAFLTASFDFFLSAADPSLGYPADGYRLVQRWCWYSLDATQDGYPAGRLFDPQTGAMTEVGQGWAAYVR